MPLTCTVVTPDAQLFDEVIGSATLPAHDGMIGILPGHAPMLLRVGSGLLTLHRAGKSDYVLFIDGGVAQVKDDVLTLLTDQAMPPSEIDRAAAQKTVDELSAATPPLNDAARRLFDRKLEKARSMLRV
jgi:F-type H+-transporting ATPase subunit epsilon